MTWEELCEKAKEMGYLRNNGLMHPTKSVFFFENRSVCIGEEVFTRLSYNQMYQIMEALR